VVRLRHDGKSRAQPRRASSRACRVAVAAHALSCHFESSLAQFSRRCACVHWRSALFPRAQHAGNWRVAQVVCRAWKRQVLRRRALRAASSAPRTLQPTSGIRWSAVMAWIARPCSACKRCRQ
jgi:hypothetical protein